MKCSRSGVALRLWTRGCLTATSPRLVWNSLGQIAIADHLTSPGLVLEVSVRFDPGGDFGLVGLGEEPPGPVSQEVGQDVSATGHWPGDRQGCRLIHGGVLPDHFGRLVVLRFTKGTPPSSNRHPTLSVIAHEHRAPVTSPVITATLI